MKQRTVGIYDIGPERVRVVLREGTGGEFYMAPEKGHIPRINIGVDHETWDAMIGVLLHEAFEMEMTRLRCRFAPHPDFGRSLADFLFIMDHSIFSDVCGRVAILVAACLPELRTAWKKFDAKP